MGRTKEKIYTDRDWEQADLLDKLYMHLLEPHRWVLSFEQDEKLEQLRKVWAIMTNKPTQRERIRLIIDAVPVASEKTVARLMKEAAHLFGDILKADTELELRLMYDRYLMLAQKAISDSDYEVARRCEDSARETLLMIEARTPVQKKVYAAVLFTSNPAALRPRNTDVEDAEYDDLTDDQTTPGLLESQAIGVPIDRSSL